ncbi:MAG: hypothetical protein JWQ23_1386 [Herminiimonas sp.]|jgi:hypothetical protein|nr:hypothetical protein [Herminiimonas sp.]
MVMKSDVIGAWALVSWEQKRGEVTGYPMGESPVGSIVYTDDGLLSVNIMRRDRPQMVTGDFVTATAAEKALAFEGYLSYFGRYEVMEDRIVHRILACSYPNWAGQEQFRFPAWDGDLLILNAPERDVNGTKVSASITWRRWRNTMPDGDQVTGVRKVTANAGASTPG